MSVEAPAQRDRILAAALDLMATRGVAGTSMRQLATACSLNVATLYHYFPSKDELLGAVIAERHYDALMRDAPLPVDRRLPPRDRLVQLLEVVWEGVKAERPVWRLLIGESLRSDPAALEVARGLASQLEGAVDRWLGDLFPELEVDRPAATSVVVTQMLAWFIEDLVAEDPVRLRRRADALALLLFPH